LYLFTISTDAKRTAAAPSLKLLALAAVIEPFLSNAGLNLDILSSLNFNGSSSVSIRTEPFFDLD